MSAYDTENIFAKILRGEIPCDKVYEDDHVLAFNDIAPQAPVHVLVIPKGAYVNAGEFGVKASADEIMAFYKAVSHIIAEKGLNKNGYRLIANAGTHGGQEVPHYHIHILAGEPLGLMLAK